MTSWVERAAQNNKAGKYKNVQYTGEHIAGMAPLGQPEF